MITVDQLKSGDRFKVPGRRRVLTKLYNYADHPYEDWDIDQQGNKTHNPKVTVKDSSGRRILIAKSKEVEVV